MAPARDRSDGAAPPGPASTATLAFGGARARRSRALCRSFEVRPPRPRAGRRAWVQSRAVRPYRLSRVRAARLAPRERVADGLTRPSPMAESRAALRRIERLPFAGARSLTPWRLASESPMAMACFGERTLPLPALRRCISSRTNSPAWVVGLFPSRASRRAFLIVALVGIAWCELRT
jgi:hypothetical protein